MISIIVPVYKTEKYLGRCIESILTQTFHDFELILVDDGSPDNSGRICDEYAEKDARIKVIHKPNGGVSSARNAGLDIAGGGYITFVDSDDWIHPQMLEILFQSLIRTNAGYSACKVKLVSDGHHDEINGSEYKNPAIEAYSSEEVLQAYFPKFEKLTMFVYNKMFCRECFDNIRFDCQMSIYEDELIAFELIEAAKTVSYVECELYYYYQSQNSLIRSEYALNRLSTFDSLQHLIDFMKQRGYEDQADELERRWLIAFLNNYYIIQQQYPELLSEINRYKANYIRKIHKWLCNRRIPKMYKVAMLLWVINPSLSRRLFLHLEG